jgi:hypothetical protein
MPPTRHRWIVDALEEHSARLEVDGGATVHVPRWLLPPAAAEGDVLSVTHDRAGAHSRLVIEVDAAATRDALAASKAQLAKAPRGGKGDVRL